MTASIRQRALRILGTDFRATYDGFCGEVAAAVLHAAGVDGDILHIAPPPGRGRVLTPSYDDGLSWSFHIVAVVRGRVYDLWAPWRPCGIRRYLARAFPYDDDLVLDLNGEPYPDGCVNHGRSADVEWLNTFRR